MVCKGASVPICKAIRNSEMKSTGEAIGYDDDMDASFYKAKCRR